MSALALSLLLLAPAGQGVREQHIELETLAGAVETRPLSGFELADPRAAGAVLVRYVGFQHPSPGPGASSPGNPRDDARLTLGTGDVMNGQIAGGDGDLIELAIAGGALIEFSIDSVVSLVFEARLPENGGAPPEPPAEGDRLYRKQSSGLDRVDGLVQSFSAGGVSFESRLGTKTYDWSEIAALFIEPLVDLEDAQGAGDAADQRAPVIVDLWDGSRLRGRLDGMDERGLDLALPGSQGLRIEAQFISEVAVDDDSFRFLSDLPVADGGPLSPFGDELGMTWPHQMDRAQSGGPLRSGGRIWSRGIGVHAPSRLTFALDGKWKEFRVQAAIDDEVLSMARRGSVIFRVFADGELKHETPIVRGGEPPLPLPPIQLTGAQELVLEVDSGPELHIADRADWLRPILVRAP